MQNGRCRLHGGSTPKGPALPQYKHGRYSKYLPTGLARKYGDLMRDPDLVSLRQEIALVDAQLQEALENESTFSISLPMIEEHRRLVVAESRRLRELEQNISVAQAMQIITLLADIVKRHVTDPDQLRAIANEIAEVASQ